MMYVLPLSDIGFDHVEQVGMKAAVLGDLRGEGFPVPDGFAVTTDALRDAIAEGGTDTGIAEIPLPAELVAQVRAGLELLGDGPVAVRSSGVAEDLAGHSFAGMYESYLNVSGVEDVLAAVRDCWASGFSTRIAAYHQKFDPGSVRIGVLVQRMVDASAAGVAFSVNPVSWREDEIVISAVSGLGDKLMSGESAADEWTVRAGGAELNSGAGKAIDAETASMVAGLVARVAAHLGAPQDMEWAVSGATVNVLQARPITGPASAAQIPIDEEVPPGFWAQAPNMDTAWVPMQRSVFLPVFADVAGNIFRYTSANKASVRMINGWTYLSLLPASPEEQTRNLESVGAAVADGAPLADVQRWNTEWKPKFSSVIHRLREVSLGSLDDTGFAKHFRELVTVFAELHEVYFTLASSGIALFGELGLTCAELFDFTPEETLKLRGGLVGDHVPATALLGELARMAAANPQLRAELESGTADPERLSTVDAAFGARFAAYLHEYGHRTVELEINEPTLAEQPAILLNLITAQLDTPYDLTAERESLARRREAVLGDLRERLAELTAGQREHFSRVLAGSDASVPVRDEKVFYAVSIWALFRYATMEIGRRLRARGLVDNESDGFYVELEEGLSALREGNDLRERVRIGRGEHNWAVANPGPRFYGEWAPPAQRSDVPLSAAAQRAQAASGWAAALRGGGGQGEPDSDRLSGIAASAGRYTGPVRVIAGLHDFGKLRKGDVLVCKETTAQWAVLFPVVGGLVTDLGSLLSHPAIIAREYGVPAVVATENATSTLRDGQLVTVDGARGTVTPHQPG